MKKVYKNMCKKDMKCLVVLLSLLLGLYGCKESGRFEIGYSDSEPPEAPEFVRYTPLNGGARIFYKIPSNEDLLSIDVSYNSPLGKKIWFSTSYFNDSIDVFGFDSEAEHTVQLYAVDRAGNKSPTVNVPVTPLEPAYLKVANEIVVKAGFGSFFLDWLNELEQSINVYLHFSYGAVERNLIYTSNEDTVRWFVRDLDEVVEPVKVSLRVEDQYGNITGDIDKGSITILQDMKIPKDKWYLPEANDSIAGEPMGFFDANEGRKVYIYDDITDYSYNACNMGHYGRTGLAKDGKQPWNLFIDMGEEYELSRIIVHQRSSDYYSNGNLRAFSIYLLDEELNVWDSIMTHSGKDYSHLNASDKYQMGLAGDMTYLYPDDPKFARPARWFRLEGIGQFGSNDYVFSEVTLYGKKK